MTRFALVLTIILLSVTISVKAKPSKKIDREELRKMDKEDASVSSNSQHGSSSSISDRYGAHSSEISDASVGVNSDEDTSSSSSESYKAHSSEISDASVSFNSDEDYKK